MDIALQTDENGPVYNRGCMIRTLRLVTFLITLSGALAVCDGVASAQGALTYYFAHIASAGIWRTTFTYVNQATVPVACNTTFYSDVGAPLLLPFNGSSISTTSDNIGPGALVRRQTDAQPGLPVATGWAVANCSGPIKASALFRAYNGNAAVAEASVPAMQVPASQFVTYADQTTGVAYANPSLSTAAVTFTAKDSTGKVVGTQSISLPANSHGSQNLGPLFGLPGFQGSVTITSSVPIISLSLNAEAAPIISSLPPGEVLGSASNGPTAYYFAHIAVAGVWRTTFTYVNASTQAVTCTTSFYSDSGSPLPLSFSGSSLSSTTDAIPAGGIARRQTDAQPNLPVTTGWASASCTGPVKASALFREYNGNVPQGEASVIAMTAPTSQFLTYADRNTGVAYANPSPSPATVTFSAQDGSGTVIGTASLTLPPLAHGSSNLGPLLTIPNFTGSVMVTSLQPIVSLSLNAEAYPSFSSLPPGDGGSFQVYGVWHCGNDSCNWASVRNMFDFDTRNHWMIDRGDGTGLPSVNLVVLSFVQPTKLLNLTNDSQTVNGIPIGMSAAIVQYFTSHNIRVMLSLGGASYVADWDQALTTNATQLGINAANTAKAMGVGIEIDYENDPSPNLAALQAFITAYRSVLPYDPTGANPAARLTIDLAAGDAYLIALAQAATNWLTGANPVLDFANATVPNGQPATSDAETNWQQHANGRTNAGSAVPALPPAKFTGAVRLDLSGVAEPECTNFSISLENNTGIFAQTLAPNGAGTTPGMLGYMFWGAETPAPTTCEGGVGSGARSYNIPIPIPPLRQQ
jgi:hypothetical protein